MWTSPLRAYRVSAGTGLSFPSRRETSTLSNARDANPSDPDRSLFNLNQFLPALPIDLIALLDPLDAERKDSL
jgi:hypothetical protein